MPFQKNSLKFYIAQIFVFLLAFFLIADIALGFFLRNKVTVYNQEEMYAVEKSMYNGFENLNTVIRSAEKIIRDNGAFFQDYGKSGNNDEIVSIVQQIKEMMVYNTYIEDVVFYKVGNERLITTKGTISKNEFFNYSYYNEENGIEFWDELMLKYNTPTIVPLSSYTNPFENAKRLFVVPKIYVLYDIGVLIFVNEQNFLNFSGLSFDELHAKIRLYDDKGELILSNVNDAVDSKLNIDKLQIEPVIMENSFFGKYSCLKWFDYENSIFSYKKWNSLVGVYFLFSFVLLMLGIFAAFYFTRHTERITEFGSGDERLSYPILLASAVDNGFYNANRQIADNILRIQEKETFAVCALFSYQNDFRLEPEMVEAIKKWGRFIILNEKFCIFLIAFKQEEEKQQLTLKMEQISSNWNCHPTAIIGKSFSSVDGLSKAIKATYMELGKYEIEKQNIGQRIYQIPSNFRSSITKLIGSNNRRGLKDYLNELIERNIALGISFDVLCYLLFQLYYEIVDATSGFDKKEQFEAIDYIFYDGMKRNRAEFSLERMLNVFFNAVSLLLDEAEKNESRLDKKEIIRYLENNYRNNVYMEEIAEQYHMTAKYFSYYFKKEFGIGFNEYLTQLRLEEGKRLLLKTALSVNEISEKSGYANVATFIVAFKKYCGETPGQFRKNNL